MLPEQNRHSRGSLAKWGRWSPAQLKDTAAPRKDTGGARRCPGSTDSRLLPAAGAGLLGTRRKLGSVPDVAPGPSSGSPKPGHSFPDDFLPLEASVCTLQITLSTPSGKTHFTNPFHRFSNMTHLYPRCGLLPGLKTLIIY